MPPLTRDQAIAQADKMLESVIADYPDHLKSTFAQMEAMARHEDWNSLHIAAHELKGQAGTVGWPIIGLVARSLDAAFVTGDEAHFAEATRVHLEAMQLCLSSNIKTQGPAMDRFLDELSELVARMAGNAKRG